MGPFPAGVCMGESNAQIGRTLRSPREQVNAPSQVARAVQDATNFNGNMNLHDKIFVIVRRAMG